MTNCRRRPFSSGVSATFIYCILAQETLAFAPSSFRSPYNANLLHRKYRTKLLVQRDINDEDCLVPSSSDNDEIMSPGERLRRLQKIRGEILASRRRAVIDQEDEARDQQDINLLLIAIVPSLLAFSFWDEISFALSTFLDVHGVLGAAGADGAQFANNLLRPTITGVVVPVISIALATLVSTTVNVLRARQVDIRALVNKEACDLRLLRRAMFGMYGTRQHAGRRSRALTLLTAYVAQVNRECHPGAIESLEELELSGGIATNELDRLSAMMHGVDGAAVSRQGSVEVADDIISRLNCYRSDRVALLLTDFPDLHYIVLIALSVSITAAFLLESNQLANQYLNSIQLRSLFALLVGVFSATATLCLDLDDPFTGSFSIVKASMQIGDLQLCLQGDVREANAEAGEISKATRKFFRSIFGGPTEGGAASNDIKGLIQTRKNNGPNQSLTASAPKQVSTSDEELGPSSTRSRYGMLTTIYFHLLTGPTGSTVRALGDVAAWVTTIAVRRLRALLLWIRLRKWMSKRSC